ncbi:hypothetical protein D9M72_531660 [compost metagenome]
MTKKGIELFDQGWYACLLVHGLIWQRAKLRAKRCNHPARKIQVASFRGAKMLLDRDHFLLRDETVPAAERLGIVGRILVICGHVCPHDTGGISCDVQAGLKTVLEPHTSDRFRGDPVPFVVSSNKTFGFVEIGFIRHVFLHAFVCACVRDRPEWRNCADASVCCCQTLQTPFVMM